MLDVKLPPTSNSRYLIIPSLYWFVIFVWCCVGYKRWEKLRKCTKCGWVWTLNCYWLPLIALMFNWTSSFSLKLQQINCLLLSTSKLHTYMCIYDNGLMEIDALLQLLELKNFPGNKPKTKFQYHLLRF